MTDDLRRFNGGPRQGAGRPASVRGYRQVAVRLPQDMAKWVTHQSMLTCGGCEAEVLRKLVRAAMEQQDQVGHTSGQG
jgi:hypothetical protein